MAINLSILAKEASKAGPAGKLLMAMYGRIKSVDDADRIYKEVHPVLEELLSNGYRFNSPPVQHIVNILRELPSYGARQHNFERMYLQDEYTLRKLPSDPRRIPYGYWAR
ncbi:hypothetical protein [Vibrio sp. MEBiC08052]|uniref:hypothetical protein n=1 Tax=Vibrio sp. MEBiC08052 TaxID=1761910 RepID=UPI0007411D3A|nr:hypothetical protein [Vibrio sp. MEBiC08052]